VGVSSLPITEFSSNYEQIAGMADAKAPPVRETNGEVERAVVDGRVMKSTTLARTWGYFLHAVASLVACCVFLFLGVPSELSMLWLPTITSEAFWDVPDDAFSRQYLSKISEHEVRA
jgi:hypothetical protein